MPQGAEYLNKNECALFLRDRKLACVHKTKSSDKKKYAIFCI